AQIEIAGPVAQLGGEILDPRFEFDRRTAIGRQADIGLEFDAVTGAIDLRFRQPQTGRRLAEQRMADAQLAVLQTHAIEALQALLPLPASRAVAGIETGNAQPAAVVDIGR